MDGKKKIWATAVLCAVASVGFVVPAGAEETMTHDLDEVIVEADRNTPVSYTHLTLPTIA